MVLGTVMVGGIFDIGLQLLLSIRIMKQSVLSELAFWLTLVLLIKGLIARGASLLVWPIQSCTSYCSTVNEVVLPLKAIAPGRPLSHLSILGQGTI